MSLIRIMLGVLLFIMSLPVSARVHAPRVISPHRADAYSMKTFGEYSRWNALEGDARAWEMYRYLADKQSGVFHMGEVREGEDALSEFVTVRDPVKIVNVYGYGYCGIFGPFTAGVCEGTDLGRARSLILNDWRHVATEVFYGGKWHYLDVDVRAVFRRPDGSLASFAESREDPRLWVGKGPLFFPNDDLEKTREIYATTPYYHHYGFHQSGHTMDFVLRQGETLTRWWTPRGGRWHHLPSYHQNDFLRRLMETPPRGPAPNHRHFTIHNYGNGRFVYRPDLTSASTDFADGVYDSGNVVPGRQGLVTEEPGTGYAIFEVRSPYIIVPKVNRMETTEDDSEASVVELEGRGVTLSISLDDGATWRKVAEKAGDGRYDLTPHVAGRYQYLLRLDLENGPQSVVDKLEVTTWVQVAPASLPSLKSGRNRMELRLNDHYGLPSRVTTLFSETQRPEVLRRQVVALPEDYDPARHTGRIRGAVTAKLEAPPKTNIAWFTAEGSFRTHQGEAAAQTENTIAYATGSPEDFEEIYRSEVPTDMGHWHFNASREVKLDEPARKLFVRFDGDPAVNHFRLFAHCIEERHRPSGSVVVTHRWTDGEGPKQKTVTLREMGSYVVEAGADPVEESLEIRVPSDAGNHAATKPTESESEVAGPPENASEADWVAPMRRVHERFTGEPGTFAQFGDSITDSRAFWTSLRWNREGASPAMLADFRVVQEHMLEDCWDRKGAEYGNQSGQTIRWASKHLDEWLERWNPEAAILMFGTNDLNNVDTEDYRATLEEVVRRCLDHGTVVIVSTIPPRHGFEEKSADFAEAARHVAENLHVPLVDFHAAILERRPDDWDGADEKFREYKGYDVPTLIARDGVHPSNPKQYRGHYSEEALRNNGFSLRNYLVLRKYAEVIRRVLEPKGTP